jgi:hypothetical protein
VTRVTPTSSVVVDASSREFVSILVSPDSYPLHVSVLAPRVVVVRHALCAEDGDTRTVHAPGAGPPVLVADMGGVVAGAYRFLAAVGLSAAGRLVGCGPSCLGSRLGGRDHGHGRRVHPQELSRKHAGVRS